MTTTSQTQTKAQEKAQAVVEHATKAVRQRGKETQIVDFENIRLIDRSEIHSNVRHEKSFVEQEIMELAMDIYKKGLMLPLLGYRLGKEVFLVDGERRYNALKWLKNNGYELPKISFLSTASDPVSVVSTMLGTGTGSRPLSAIEVAIGIKKLRELGLSVKEASVIAGVTVQHAHKLLRLSNLPSLVVEALIDKKISANIVYEIMDAENNNTEAIEARVAEVLEMESKTGRENLTRRDVKDAQTATPKFSFTNKVNAMRETENVQMAQFLATYELVKNAKTQEELLAIFA